MNRIYKVIFNRSLGLYQVVSEIARNHGRSSSHAERGRKSLLVPFVLSTLLGLGLTGSALAEGTGTTVANAAVTVKDGDQMQGTGAASVSSRSQTDESGKTTTTITVAVPNDGKVENGNTGLVTGGTVYAAVNKEQTAREAEIGTLDDNGSYIQKDASVSSNLSALDTQVKTNADAISKEKTDREAAVTAAVTNVTNTVSTLSDSAVKYDDTGSNKGKVTLAGEGGTTITNVKDGALSDSSTDAVTGKQLYNVSNRIGTLDANGTYIKKGVPVSSNLSTLDTQVKSNADAISTETTKREKAVSDEANARTNAINALETKLTSGGSNSLASKANVDASNIGNNLKAADGTSDDDKKVAIEKNLEQWGRALGVGVIASQDSKLLSGGTLFTELRPADGTYSYISGNKTTAVNLKSLDSAIAALGVEMLTDKDGNPIQYTSSLFKYFKVNPETTANDDGTKTYAPDAAANGKNSVAIGPSAQAGDKSTDAATSTTTITGGKSSTAIGDSAKANGDQSVALGYGSEVLNVSGSTTAVSGSTAIGSSAKVEGGSDSTALGSGATVDTASGAMALGKGATINKTAASGVAIGNGAVTGSADKTITVNNLSYNVNAAGGVDSVAIGTDASNAGNTSLALGKGATVENDSDGNYQAVVKSDDIAIGTDAKTSASDFSTAIGKGASVAQSTDALAIGSSAAVGASSNDAMALGKGAAVGSGAADSIAMGTKAKTISADTIAIGQNTSATGANSVVIGKSAQTTSEGGNAIGSSSTASGRSTAIGQSATANNFDALAIGNGATANVDRSISLGYNAGVGTSEGKGEPQNAGSLIAIGTSAGNNVSGMQNVAIGESAGSNVKSSNNIAIGTQAGYGINYASDNKVQNGYNVSIGYKANYQENAANIMYATALGNEANASNYAVAIGDGAKASGTNSLALGYSAQASDAESMALGHNASAADGNVAIGNGSLAPSVSTLGTVRAVTVDGKTINYVYDANNNQFKSAFTSKPLQADSHYISVGNSTLTRRLSNVADGVFDSDAATVGQLNSLNELLQATDTKVGLTRAYFDDKFTALNTTVDASKTHYFSISESSDNLSANKDNTGATSNKADAMAIGPNANATNVKSLAVGNNVYATGLRSIAIGTAPNPTKDVAGTTTTHNTSAEGENSIALGTSTTAQADNSIAIGTRAQTYTTDTTSKTGAGSVAIGNLATTAGNQSVALGYDATVKYDYGTAIGSEALASGTDAVAVGKGSKAYSTDSTAIGQNNTVTGSNVYGLGSSNAVSGNWGSIVQSGVSGYKNAVTSVSDQDTTNALTGVYMTGSSNTLNQDVKYNVMQDITVQGSSNTIDGGAGGTSGHPNTLSQIAIVGSDNTVQGKSSDDSKTNNIKDVTILGYNNKVDANTDTTVDFSNTQILGSNVTAKLGNSVYLGSNAAYIGQTPAASDAITSARTAADATAEASDAYKAATTDAEKAQIKAQYEAQYLYKLNVQAMEAKGTTAGTQSYSTDETYGDGTSYTYAGSSPAGVVTVGSVGAERRIQNVAAGLVSASSTDAVNGSQLYALTRQIRFGGDNSSFGTTTADDKNVVARGSNETIAITGGSDAVTASTTDGNTTYTVDTKKLTDNNIAVVADTDKNALHVQLASSLKDLNTAQLGSGSGDSYKETIKLDGTGITGGQMTLAGADGTVKTTLDTTGLTITNGPKFTSSGIDAASQKITSVEAGEADTDAANVGQVKAAAAEATTEVKAGTNAFLGTVDTSAADKHKIYTVNVDNLAVKANGTGTTTVELAKGINFQNGTNTTATVGTDGTVTVSATHNKLSTVSAAANGANDDVILTLTDADGNTVTSTGLKNTYTTVTKDGTAHTVTFARNDGTTETSLSLGDLDGASKSELATAAAKATSEVTNGTNVTSVTKTTGNNNQNIYTVNVDDLAVKTTDGEKKSVHLKDGLVFADGTNTTATVGDNGTVKFNVSDNAIKKQAVNAINVTGGSNVTVTPETNADGTLKTFTVAASDLKYSANGTSKTTSLANGISFAAGSNTTAEIDNNGAIKINATHNKLNATGTATKATADSNAVTLTLNDQDGNTTTTALTDTYTTVSKDATNKKVTFKRNDGETQTLELSDLGGITEAQDKYVTGGKVTYEANGNGTAALTGNNGLTASITGLKDTKVSSGTASYAGTQGNASGSATLTMNDGTKATISGLKDDYITSAAVGTENNHVTMTRLGGGTVDLNLNPILEKYSLSDYHLVGAGTTHDKAYAVDSNGTVTLNVVDDKNPNGAPKTIQITGLASQSGVNAGRTTVTSSDNSVTVSDSTANSDTHTYDIKVDYSKIPANLTVQYSGDNGTSGSNTLNTSTAFSGTAGQIVTTAADGKVSFKLADNISGIQSVTTGDVKLATTGLTITDGPSVLKSGINAGGKTISNVGDAVNETDAATLKQVKNARTVVAAGDNVKKVAFSEATDGSHQMTYTVNVDNLSVKSNDGTAKEVALKTGLNFKNGINTTATVGDNGEVKYDLNSTLTGLTSVTAGNSTLDNSGLTIKEGTTTKVAITGNNVTMGGNIIHNVGDGVAPTDAVNKGQLDALQSQVRGGWNLSGTNSEGTAVTAQIGAGKTVTYSNGSYTKSVVTKDDTTGNATVKVDVTTGTFGLDAGKAASVTNGLATTQDVANAINSASISVVADDTPENKTAVKAGDTIHFAKDGNLTLVQNGTTFTYGLNPEINISKVTTSDTTKGSTVQTAEGVTTTDAAGNTYIQNGQGITLTPSDKTKPPVKLTNTGLDNGGNKITGVGKGTDDTDAVNVAQLKEVNDKVGSGWQIAGNDGTRVADIGAGKKVSFKTDSQYLTAKTESAGTDAANVTYGLKTKALEVADGKVSSVDTAEDGLATAKNVADTINQTYWTAASGKSGSGSQTDETANDADKKISAGDTVTFNAGNNLSLAQNGASFTYGLQADLTGMNTITFTPRNDAEGHPISLVIGKQKDGVGTDEGYYITGLDNTTWNQSNYVKDRAATEAQLADAIKQVTLASQSGGFKLSDDNDKEVSQVLGKAIGVVGDGNITTTAETTTADPNGHIKVSLKKNIDLGTDGSLQAGGVTLKNNSVIVGNNGIVISSTDSEKTVSNLSNTTWDTAKVNQEASAGGYKGSTKAATESQLAEAISTATSTASANEQHIKDGSYSVTTIDNGDGTKSQGVSIDIITGDGSKPEAVKGHVVIKDVAKASDLGNVSDLHDTLKNADGKKNVTGALNNLDDRVTGLDNRMNNIYTTAGQHSSVSAEENIKIDASSTNKSGGTDYKLSLNKDEIHLGNVTFKGNAGAIEAKSMKAYTFTAGDTVASNEGVKVGDKTALTRDTLKVNGKTYVSGDGLNANSQKITNVAAGSADTDAVNVKQVNDLAARQGEAITENAAHIGELGRAVNKLDNRINRVGAGAAALAALHPGSYDPDDKLDVSAGVGNYRGANAAAVGLFFHPNERTILSVAGSMGGGENMVNAGVTLKVGPGHGTPTTVTTKTGEKVDVMDILAKQTEILEKLAGNTKAASAPAGSDIFPDVPQNHWAYAYVDKLYRAGSLAGFSEPGKLKSHMLTRKDFAEILYWAMTNGATTNPDLNSDGSLNRLAAEFGAELKLVMK
ncbi:ESPR-type extended signal peptide-containing protein [uncultured Dialister sp.]|uniref:ESPR-type extended signal peptide-containing protein n=1 Tax=uncultured Dialister sp. TaxID=278064 RepID=UPI002658DCD1|nr:ESPR-type extended signal peptide-containing protein [uncultured Dialister sp.]